MADAAAYPQEIFQSIGRTPSPDARFVADQLKHGLSQPHAVLVLRFRQRVNAESLAFHWGVVVDGSLHHILVTEDGLLYRKDTFDQNAITIHDATFWGITRINGDHLNEVARRFGKLFEGPNFLSLYSNCQDFTEAFADFICDKKLLYRPAPPSISTVLGYAAAALALVASGALIVFVSKK